MAAAMVHIDSSRPWLRGCMRPGPSDTIVSLSFNNLVPEEYITRMRGPQSEEGGVCVFIDSRIGLVVCCSNRGRRGLRGKFQWSFMGGAPAKEAVLQTVTYTFTGASPTAVATQIGTGSYTQASLQANKLTLSIPSGTSNYSVAFLCPSIPFGTPDYQEYVVQAAHRTARPFPNIASA